MCYCGATPFAFCLLFVTIAKMSIIRPQTISVIIKSIYAAQNEDFQHNPILAIRVGMVEQKCIGPANRGKRLIVISRVWRV